MWSEHRNTAGASGRSRQGICTTGGILELIMWAVGSHFKSFKQRALGISIISMDPDLSIYTPSHWEISLSAFCAGLQSKLLSILMLSWFC